MRQRGNDVMPLERDEMRDELRAILSARDELGPDAEQNLVEHFLDLLDERGLSSQRPTAERRRGRFPSPSRIARWLSLLLVLWVTAGISSIALGFPWSLGSTAPAQVFAASVISGYAAVLIVLVFAVCMAWLAWAVARYTRGSGQLDYHPGT